MEVVYFGVIYFGGVDEFVFFEDCEVLGDCLV